MFRKSGLLNLDAAWSYIGSAEETICILIGERAIGELTLDHEKLWNETINSLNYVISLCDEERLEHYGLMQHALCIVNMSDIALESLL